MPSKTQFAPEISLLGVYFLGRCPSVNLQFGVLETFAPLFQLRKVELTATFEKRAFAFATLRLRLAASPFLEEALRTRRYQEASGVWNGFAVGYSCHSVLSFHRLLPTSAKNAVRIVTGSSSIRERSGQRSQPTTSYLCLQHTGQTNFKTPSKNLVTTCRGAPSRRPSSARP